MEAADGGEGEGVGEAGVCHVLKGQHRVYLRSHRKASSKSAEHDAIFPCSLRLDASSWGKSP